MNSFTVTCSLLGDCVRLLWALGCIAATLFTAIWQLNQYCNGPDRTIVEYKRFNDKEIDVYPSVGICFSNTMLEGNLKKYGDDINQAVYLDFLSGGLWNQNLPNIDSDDIHGSLWDPNLLTINYDEVTQNLGDYIKRLEYITANSSTYKVNIDEGDKLHFKEYSFLGSKCLAMDMNYSLMSLISI